MSLSIALRSRPSRDGIAMGAVVPNDDVLPTVPLALVNREVVYRVSGHRRPGHRSDYRIGELAVVADVVRQPHAVRIWPLMAPTARGDL